MIETDKYLVIYNGKGKDVVRSIGFSDIVKVLTYQINKKGFNAQDILDSVENEN